MKSITLNFVGDVMLGELFENYKKGVKSKIVEEKMNPFKFCRKEFANSDLNIANLECVISNHSDRQKPFSEFLRLPAQFAYILKNNYINIVNLANNHFLDHGRVAAKQMIEVLTAKGIKTFGYSFNNLFQKRSLIIIIRNIKLGFLGYNISNLPYSKVIDISKEIDIIITKEKKKVDLLILSLHWGYEYVNFPAYKFVTLGKNFLEKGADIIYGHHSHQLQGIVNYQGKIFAPSLGNFIFDNKLKECRITAILKVKIDPANLRISYNIVPYYINDDFQPEKNIRYKQHIKKLNNLFKTIIECNSRAGKIWDMKAFKKSQFGHLKNKLRIRLLFILRISNYHHYIWKIIKKKLVV